MDFKLKISLHSSIVFEERQGVMHAFLMAGEFGTDRVFLASLNHWMQADPAAMSRWHDLVSHAARALMPGCCRMEVEHQSKAAAAPGFAKGVH